MADWKMLAKKLAVYKYPLLLPLIGVFLLLLPSHAQNDDRAATVGETLEELLTESSGVGRIRVIVSSSFRGGMIPGRRSPGRSGRCHGP